MVFNSRNRELFGLIFVFIILATGFSELSLVKDKTWDILSVRLPIVLGIFFLITHVALRLQAPRADATLLPLTFFLTGIGALTISRIKPEVAGQQLIWIALGQAILIITLLVLSDYSRLADYKYLFGLLGLALLLSPVFFGREVGGAKLWLNLAGYSFQPAELAKVFLAIFFAAYLQEKRELLAQATRPFLGFLVPEIRHFGPLLTMWGVSLIVLVFEKDLGSSLLFFGLFLAMIYIATGRGAYVATGFILFLIGAGVSYLIFSHVETRIIIWLQRLPDDVSGQSYQVAQSLFALSAGGLSGTGLGEGFLGTRIFMPAVLTDFIFSSIGEELGLAGAGGLVLAYLYMIYRGTKIALAATEDFGRLLSTGLIFSLGLQVLVIIGGVIKLIPLTGVTLPFVSYGGSSIIANFILLGILLSISEEEASGNG